MSTWSTASFDFTPFKSVTPQLKSALKVLKAVEAILEALMELVKPFMLDSGNPVKPVIALLLASVRALINQIRGGAVSMLLVHPDFTRQDFDSVLESVSGGYSSFESKVVAKFNDQSDPSRPSYPSGSAAAMVVFYVGATNPGDLLTQLFSLLSLVKHPAASFQLPAPVELKVRPIFKSDSAAAQVKGVGLKVASLFSDQFSDQLDKKLVLEWRMPKAPVGSSPSFANHLVSFNNAFLFTNFIVERSEFPTGTPVRVAMKTPSSSDASLKPKVEKYSIPSPDTSVDVREPGGDAFRFFEYKAEASGSSLFEGAVTGAYRFVDEDPNLEHGKTYNYRVRACLGSSPSAYVSSTLDSFTSGNSPLLVRDGGKCLLTFGDGVAVGPPSSVVRGFVPRQRSAGSSGFNPSSDVYDAVVAGLLLNFELPPAQAGDTADELEQKTGWGSLSPAAAQVGLAKSSSSDSDAVRKTGFFQFAARRVANTISSSVYDKPQMVSSLAEKWESGVKETVHRVLNAEFKWKLVGVVGGYNQRSAAKVKAYLSKEATYQNQFSFPENESASATDTRSNAGSLDGPYPVKPLLYRDDPVQVTVEQRQQLADFLRLALASSPQATGYMSWYTVSVADMFPAIVPFAFDLEQLLLAMMKALDSIVKEVEAIIQTIVDKIVQLEQLLESLDGIINFMSVKASVSMLTYSGTNTSASDMCNALQSSENKPSDDGFGLYSGLVVTAGGPGAGAVQAVKAIGFLLGFSI